VEPAPRPDQHGVTAVGERRDALTAGYGFALDDFQRRALDALDAGHSVLVAAPTGSGKTVVAEYAVAAALLDGRRAFYTAPIKALSNQKYHDLRVRHGAEAVGLLTGDNAVNGEAPVVVMTTEVLRNMIYAGRDLRDLEVVVLDEVHFLQDTYRGPVWEEVIVHLPGHVRLVCLSATVSNADEVAEWISTVRGPTDVVVETRRPVHLDQVYLVGDRTSERLHVLPTFVDGRPNPEASRLDEDAARTPRTGRGRQRARRTLYTPSRIDVVERLDDLGLLPAIYFIFSRNACSDAAQHCLDAGLRLTTGPERDRVREIVDERLGSLEARDLAVLGYHSFVSQLEAGLAAHHAGMIPPFKEVVEACFVESLVKVVFATETLAVGINMPARSVVIEKLTKFTGDHHAFLTPGEYTQLTGRAGRRGIDERGTAAVLWSPFVTFEQVAALASSTSFRLVSAFRPTYNMAANLVRSYRPDEARHLLNLSFAQFQADRDVVKLETRLERRAAQAAALREDARSPYGDIDDYRAQLSRRDERALRADVDEALARLRPGDVITIDKGRHYGRAVVLSTATRKGALRIVVLTPSAQRLQLGATDVDVAPVAQGRLEFPVPFTPNRAEFQRAVARLLRQVNMSPSPPGRRLHDRSGDALEHPVEADPALRARLDAAASADRIDREVAVLRRRVTSRTQSVARTFDTVLDLLERWGYVADWSLTEAGEMLARVFHESDLLVAECLREGVLDDLDPPAVAALVSVFVHEHRSPEPPPAPWFPSKAVAARFRRIAEISADLEADERGAGLVTHRPPEPGFVAVAWAWASGERFSTVVEGEEVTGGDFVRTMRQLIDLLEQLAVVAPRRGTRRAAALARDLLFRGVVAASSRLPDVDTDADADAGTRAAGGGAEGEAAGDAAAGGAGSP
jgi:ATP-dependent RNA helicase HelY